MMSFKVDKNKSPTVINFVHANGFPAGAYKTFVDYFLDEFTVIAHKKFGHNIDFPLHNNWQYLVDELIDYLEKKVSPHQSPAITVGHSFGGTLAFMAACKRPDLFKGIIMLDPPVITGLLALFLKALKNTHWVDKLTPAGKATNRRIHWPKHTNMEDFFSHSPLFLNFDNRCLKDYCQYGIIDNNDEWILDFDAKIEASIFRHLPTNLSKFKGSLIVPAALVYGRNSNLYPHYFFRCFAQQHEKITLYETQGGHMFPLEYPQQVTSLIKDIIKLW
jgi:pimeloyl-ACP methyl ester carboxylesterase